MIVNPAVFKFTVLGNYLTCKTVKIGSKKSENLLGLSVAKILEFDI